MARMRAPV
uniref:Transmembrane protein 184b isoform x1 n=1 Tax=Triatoma infestans TaxID=30076 RepID=A0A170UNB4_TRIIF